MWKAKMTHISYTNQNLAILEFDDSVVHLFAYVSRDITRHHFQSNLKSEINDLDKAG